MKDFGLTGNLISMKFVGTFFVVSIMTLYGMTESSIILLTYLPLLQLHVK